MTPFHEWRDAPAGDYAVIGDPVSHSLSPRMHAAAYAALGQDLAYRAIRVPAGEVGGALERLREVGYRGVNVTVPHKAEALAWCATAARAASDLGSANTLDLVRRHGISTDGPGFLLGMGDAVRSRWDAPVLMLGAGGSARAVAGELAEHGWEVRVWNRTPERAAALAEAVGGVAVAEPDPAGCEIVINATSTSLSGTALPVPWARAPGSALAVDLMYGDGPTSFLAAAAARGLETADGRRMLAGQGALAFEFWLGPRPFDVMLAAIT